MNIWYPRKDLNAEMSWLYFSRHITQREIVITVVSKQMNLSDLNEENQRLSDTTFEIFPSWQNLGVIFLADASGVHLDERSPIFQSVWATKITSPKT